MVDWDGAGYEQISDLQRWLAGRALAAMHLRGDERVLDVGCGDGYVSRLLAAELPHGSVTGVDASPRMIEVARSRPAPAGARLRFDLRNVLDRGFSDNYSDDFDLVVSFNALHWVADQRAALSRLAAAATADGCVVVQVVSPVRGSASNRSRCRCVPASAGGRPLRAFRCPSYTSTRRPTRSSPRPPDWPSPS